MHLIVMTVMINARVRKQHLRATAERDATVMTVMIHITKMLCPRTTSAVPRCKARQRPKSTCIEAVNWIKNPDGRPQTS
jgi:hypothetical protein